MMTLADYYMMMDAVNDGIDSKKYVVKYVWVDKNGREVGRKPVPVRRADLVTSQPVCKGVSYGYELHRNLEHRVHLMYVLDVCEVA